jgi:hypothetical protein
MLAHIPDMITDEQVLSNLDILESRFVINAAVGLVLVFEKWEILQDALEESSVNALCQRDYYGKD